MKARIITGAKAIQESPVTSVALKKALDTLIEPVKETGLLAEYYRMTGRKPEEPAKVIKEYTVNGLQCKIVSTKRN
jgi:hypothetical protein